jgi:hypothetical protein
LRVVRPAKKRGRFDEVIMPADGTSLPSPPQKFRHPSRVRGSSQKDCTPRSQRQPYRALGTPKVVQIPHKP